ncbi:MAG: M48 family metalloprotease [Candidatus Latescibacteria bacterium]|nr:M48 family metalloprotease [Candidatus Latescibacterota bacterium]NIM22299.1 M48 family metalloprotease [Candidatus Latescibacterota bacterium]NIM66128.1 M48 family metalloprotease [Candidatus Latescibacterota bacterium]NIO02536.1 M48 family metalloprotease [Candidatus Latescibacterota bacterium]NIO29450.1 M48 family metalloprotease [Candidatus Latescibacterota bacterium]
MWEIIAANKRKSIILFSGMALCLVLLGYFIGAAIEPEHGGISGLFLALGIWAFLSIVSYFSGDKILLTVSGARKVTHDLHPQLFNVVEEMKIAANLPAMPDVYIIDEPAPNAFAIGIKPEKCAVAVTAGLLSRLNRDELQGVIAHEISHILNRDVQFMTFAGIMLGSIVLVSEIFLRWMWFAPGAGRRYRSRSSSKFGGDHWMIVVGAIALAILGPIFARLLYFAISRKREYLADASAVRLTRYPEGLASALEKIALSDVQLQTANKVTAPMYIVNPLTGKKAGLTGLTSTHPPIHERIMILRTMTRGADYLDYQRAFSKMKGKPTMIIPTSGLKQSKGIQIREGSIDKTAPADEKDAVRKAFDLMRAMNGYAFLVCACGLKIKLPPDFDKPELLCPRCGRTNHVPTAELAAVGAAAGVLTGVGGGETLEPAPAPRNDEAPLEYVRKGKGWETYFCSCGKRMQISPAFCATHMSCTTCGRITKIIDHTTQ